MSDKVIQFPGPDEHEDDDGSRADSVSSQGDGSLGIPGLSVDQEKAIRIAMEGMGFVMVGIKPTDDGADFFTAIHGTRGDLADAAPHIDGVIQRALGKQGL